MTIEATLERIAVALERIATLGDTTTTITSVLAPVGELVPNTIIPVEAPVETPVKKRGRPKKTAEVTPAVTTTIPAAISTAAPVVEEDPFEGEDTTAVDPPVKLTPSDIRSALTAFTNAGGGRESARELLKKFGNGAEAIPGSPAASTGGVRVLQEVDYKAVYDAVLAAHKVLVTPKESM